MTTVNSESSLFASQNCSQCGIPLGPGDARCSRCGVGLATPRTGSSPVPPATFSYGGVSSWEKLLGIVVDGALGAVTAGIGWLIWTAVLFPKRQTPAGRLRDMVVVDSRTARLASALKYAARQIVLALMYVYMVSGFFWGFGLVLDIGGFWINTFVIPVALSGLVAIDILWVFLPSRRRLIDVILHTNVVEGQGISFLESAPTNRGGP